MASIEKRGKRWRVRLYVNGVRDSGTFAAKAEAARWALEREAELSGKQLPRKTLAQALQRYAEEVSPSKKGERWELMRLNRWRKDLEITKRPVASITGADMAEWRDARLKKVSNGTVAREMNLWRSVFEACRRDWQWVAENPMQDIRRPTPPPPRRRRVTDDESDRIVLGLGYVDGAPQNLSQRVAVAWLLALETAMRAGEIIGLEWSDVFLRDRFVRLPRTKNGDQREVPLSSKAVELLKSLPRGDGPVFGLTAAQRDALFRKARDRTKLDIHFHDSRAEAIWRLSKKIDVLQLARVIGHRDIRSLMLYYNESAADLAKRLD